MRTLILALALLFTFPVMAQEEAETTTTTTTDDYNDAVNKKEIKTLFGSGKTHHGGFGALEFGYTEFY